MAEVGPDDRLPAPGAAVDYRELVEHSPSPCFETYADGTCTYVNRAWTVLSGLSREQSMGLGWTRAVLSDDLPGLMRNRPAQVAAGRRYEQRFRIRSPDGLVRSMHVVTHPVRAAGRLTGWLGWLTDVTRAESLQSAVAERDALVQAVFDSSAAGLVVIDAETRIVKANAVFCEWMGASEAELIGEIGFDLLTPAQQDESRSRVTAALGGMPQEPIHRTLVAADGREIHLWTAIAPIPDTDPLLLVVNLTEFTSRVHRETQLEHRANHDPLTGLPNRHALEEWTGRTDPAAAVLIDLNGFKEVNDNHGHESGDRALAEVAARLQQCVRHADLICRYGGDEFLVLLADAPPGATDALLARIAEAFRRPFRIGRLSVTLSAAVGVAQGEYSVSELARAADRDLYLRKQG